MPRITKSEALEKLHLLLRLIIKPEQKAVPVEIKKQMTTTWKPISLSELHDEIYKTEIELNGELWNFWELIKIDPAKWTEKKYGHDGGGFWVVAICGTKIIWYNDIEDGFNISDYRTYGQIERYYCNQDELNSAVTRLFDLVKFGGEIIGQAGPPQNLVK